MVKGLRSSLSFSNVIALVALFVALGGTVYAAAKIDGGSIQKESIKGNRLKPDTITGKQVKESKLGEVPKANAANSATTATSATTAASAQPVAFARIDSDGTVDAANSKGVTQANVTHPAAGAYCVSGIGFPIRGAQVTSGFGGSITTGTFTLGSTGNCPNGGQVITGTTGVGTASNVSFFILLYG